MTKDHKTNRPTEAAVAQAIEQNIVFGRLSPGERLREESLARELGATRHHVRAALTTLENAGIVVRERNKGANVRAYSPQEVRQLYDVREMLTRQAALRIALPAPDAKIVELQRVQSDYEAAIVHHSLPAIHEANDRFHATLFGLSDNPYLVDLIQRSMQMTYVIRAANLADPIRLAGARAEHRMILSLLSGSDIWALSELCVKHLQPSKEAYLRRLESE